MTEKASSLNTRSRVSGSQLRSRASSTGSAAVRARARAEAAKARLSYAEEEMNLRLEKAKLEASMEMLNIQKETAAVIAEAEVFEAAEDLDIEKERSKNCLSSVSLEAALRTQQYVADQAKITEAKPQLSDHYGPAITKPSPGDSISHSQLKPEAKPFILHQTNPGSQSPHITSQQPGINGDECARGSRNVKFENNRCTPGQYYRPQNHSGNPSSSPHPMSPNYNHDDSNLNDFVRYFALHELVATGLLQFNEKPQNYRAWKRSFQTATRGLNLTPSEEMDLLHRWLGNEARQHVEQIRAIHINHPEAGLAMTWDRLERTYGSPEVIEDALFKRIDTFPKITNQDYSKLTKLSDLLMELQSAKAEGDLPGLSFLDTARGVNPIVQKLPFGLQEKWASVGASYKRQNLVHYPPFDFFVNFVSQEAIMRNDPSFNFASHTDTAKQNDKTGWKPNKYREVSVHKTEIFPGVVTETGEPPTRSEDFDKMCPIHEKPHPLRKCRTFRAKPIDERKAFLKENNVCLRCCSSSSHFAKNCKMKMQCFECKSERHHTALHPGPAPWMEEVVPAPEHGGEEEKTSPPPHVTTKCTNVCGGDLAGRSCSKICLVNVYPSGHKDKAIKLYAILDEQSNRSLVRSQFFEMFSDQSPSVPYTLRTCAGVKESAGRRASGYEVESLDGTVHIPLPSFIECNDIPNNRN
ncbi:uncharacterized protein LOC117536928 [Gymnodraco acuticeps]|uniref:Uncharacterized protein LOC117536928 n=1 Tax=Gymnodraco acuticeps TaxID=8218 RepID=A0A6P8T305_GYMAC|nr:uncharacterized protein LOC117536928 [Gymnodraco acuticeps]